MSARIVGPAARQHQLTAMLNDAELEHVAAEAEAIGTTRASYLRALIHADIRRQGAARCQREHVPS